MSKQTAAALDRNLLLAVKGGGILLAGKLFTYASRFVNAVLLARLLAASMYGQYSLSLTTVEVLAGLGSLGLTETVVRFVPMLMVRKDKAGVRGTLEVCLGVTTGLGLALGLALFILADPVAQLVLHKPQVTPLLRLVSVFLPFFMLNDLLAAATRGFKNMKYTTLAQFIVHPALKVVLLLLFALAGLNSARALTAAGVAEIAVSLILIYFLKKQIEDKGPFPAARREPGELFQFSLPIYFSFLLDEFAGRLQVLFLGLLSTLSSVGVFALCRELSRISEAFQASVRMSSEPIVSELLGKGGKSEFEAFYRYMTRWAITLNLPLFLVLILLPKQILSFFGASFAGGATVLVVLGWRRIIHTTTGLARVVLDMTGYNRLKLLNSVVRLVLIVGLNLLLIPRWGALGAAIAAFLAEGTVCFLRQLEIFVLLRALPYDRALLKPLTAAVITAALVTVVRRAVPPEPVLLYTTANAAFILVTYLASLLVMGLSSEDRMVLTRFRARASQIWSGNGGRAEPALKPSPIRD